MKSMKNTKCFDALDPVFLRLACSYRHESVCFDGLPLSRWHPTGKVRHNDNTNSLFNFRRCSRNQHNLPRTM